MAEQLSGVMTLECLGEVVEERDERGGGGVGELERQDDDGQVVGLHVGRLVY